MTFDKDGWNKKCVTCIHQHDVCGGNVASCKNYKSKSKEDKEDTTTFNYFCKKECKYKIYATCNTFRCESVWNAGATWQREQLEAEIKNLKDKLARMTLMAHGTKKGMDDEIQQARNSVIKELRDTIEKEKYFYEEQWRINISDITAKLDLLEKGGEYERN